MTVPEKTRTENQNFTNNWLSKLAQGHKSSSYIKENVNCKPYFEFHSPSAFIGHTPWTWIYLKFPMNINFFRAGALILSIFMASIFTFLSLFLFWTVKVLRFLNGKSQTFIFVVGNNRERWKRSCGKKNLFFVKNSSQSFFPSTLFSVLKTNSIKIFEIFLKNKPVITPSIVKWWN